MVTNLPPQAEAQYKKVVASRSKEEKLENLRIFLSMIPEHKGTEKLRAQVKRQISRLQEEIITEKKKRSTRAVTFEKGDTSVLTAILSEDKKLLYEFLACMKLFDENLILESLNELKPLSTGFEDIVLSFIPLSPSMVGRQKYSLIQTILLKSDLIIVLLSIENLYEEFNLVKEMLRKFGIYVASKKSVAIFKSLATGGVTVLNRSRFLSEEEVKSFMKEKGVESGIIQLSEYTSLYTLEGSVKGLQRKNFLIIVENHEGELPADQLCIPKDSIVSLRTFLKNDVLKTVFKASGLIRVYLKPPSAVSPSSRPLLVDEETTVQELALKIHKDLSENLKYARLWRGGFSSKPLRVGSSFKLMDGDVIELRTR
ncbi:MAG: TGS domain-containing protein [Thaumarchaeota archaeon]|jgi:ribosome-interacting GTPase 1|nr:TGS domain-containing protein [Nitrososphaerota archaeon]